MQELKWPPLYSVIEEQIRSGDDLILLIVPYIKLEALQKLISAPFANKRLQVVVRWRPEDLLSSVSDLDVYTYLKRNGCQLYFNPKIHLKLYVYNSNIAFITSANLTLSGLGYRQNANVEVGNMVSLTQQDWDQINFIINHSRLVDDEIFKYFVKILKQHPRIEIPKIPLDSLPPKKIFTISSLPATEIPEKLANYYFDTSLEKFTHEEVRRAAHDLAIFHLVPNLGRPDFDKNLSQAFCNTPFVIDFIELIKKEGSLRFGAVNNWIHEKCEDVPLPYRWEIKENTHIFYDWLTYFIPQISWDRPNHSQVIYWKETVE